MAEDGARKAGWQERLSEVVLGDEPLDDILDLLCRQAKEAIPHADDVSTTLMRNGGFETAAHTHDHAKKADEIQYDLGEGPCVDAARQGEMMVITSLEEERRWPRYIELLRETRVASSVSVPLRAASRSVGALNVYAQRPNAFDELDRELAEGFARQAGVLLANAVAYLEKDQLTHQLQEALESREVVGKAIGIVMAREGLTEEDALARLRSTSQNANIKVRDIARELVTRLNQSATPQHKEREGRR